VSLRAEERVIPHLVRNGRLFENGCGGPASEGGRYKDEPNTQAESLCHWTPRPRFTNRTWATREFVDYLSASNEAFPS
jgi:hypothetical protein